MSRTRSILPAALALLGACATTDRDPLAGETVRRRLALMGTGLELEVTASDRGVALAASEAAVRALEETGARLSTWTDASELARLNAAPVATPVPLSPTLAAELSAAWGWSEVTEGAFDPVVGALVRAWDLRGAGHMPSEPELALALAGTGRWRFELGSDSATRRSAGASIEEGGFGKGAGLDRALAALVDAGVTRATLDLGGQLAFLGRGTFPVEVAHPSERDLTLLTIHVTEGSVATSGNSERGLVVDGQKVGHLLDPRTGRPAPDFGSVTVWAGSALAADALATGCFVLGPARALALGERLDGVEVLVVEADEHGGLRVRATPGWGLRPDHLHRGHREAVALPQWTDSQ